MDQTQFWLVMIRVLLNNYNTFLDRLAEKIARKDSLAIKLALRPNRQELINRNILQVQSDKERQETKEVIGARLIRYLNYILLVKLLL